MINKRFTILDTEINANTDIVLDTEIIKTTTSPTGNTDTRYLYPLEIQIINDCQAGVEWLLVSDETEFLEYSGSPPSYTFVRLPYGHILQENFNSLGRCYKFIVKGYETTASGTLVCEFINYKPSLK
jgi:hypothetical protein